MAPRGGRLLIALSMFVMGACGIIYEYVLSVLGNNLIGSRYEEILIIIGIMLFAMGMGSMLQSRVVNDLIDKFLMLEIALGFVGGMAPMAIYALYTVSESFQVVLYGSALLIGGLIGMEIPVLIRINKEYVPELKVNLSNILSMDYVGSLAGSLVFVFVLLTHVSLGRIGFLMGLVNTGIAVVGLVVFANQVKRPRRIFYAAAFSTVFLGTGFFTAEDWSRLIEQRYYKSPIVFSETSQYQHIVLVERMGELRLFLNQHTQFASSDEAIYHELLVHPAMVLASSRKRVLILGGGDGLALREVLKYPDVESVTLVDIDPAVIRMAATEPHLVALNERSIADARVSTVIPDMSPPIPEYEDVYLRSERRTSWGKEGEAPVGRVQVLTVDADLFLAKVKGLFDVAILDFPDAGRPEVAKLFSLDFYTALRAKLTTEALAVVQSTSVSHAKLMFLCIGETLRAAGYSAVPYHEAVPSFRGEWGFHLISPQMMREGELLAAMRSAPVLPERTRHVTPEVMAASTVFGKTALAVDLPIELNTKMNPVLVRYNRMSWKF